MIVAKALRAWKKPWPGTIPQDHHEQCRALNRLSQWPLQTQQAVFQEPRTLEKPNELEDKEHTCA